MITPELVRKIWSEALDHFNARSVNKEDSEFMEVVGGFLDLIRVTDKREFLGRFTTTIGRTIYRPFEIGVADGVWTLQDQIVTLCHELVHVEQYTDSPLIFSLGYCSKPSVRAKYEAKAYAADMEVDYYLTGKLYDIPSRAACLLSYGLNQSHVDFAASVMESVAETIVQGASVNGVAAWIIDRLKANGI